MKVYGNRLNQRGRWIKTDRLLSAEEPMFSMVMQYVDRETIFTGAGIVGIWKYFDKHQAIVCCRPKDKPVYTNEYAYVAVWWETGLEEYTLNGCSIPYVSTHEQAIARVGYVKSKRAVLDPHGRDYGWRDEDWHRWVTEEEWDVYFGGYGHTGFELA